MTTTTKAHIRVERDTYTKISTIGKLYINNEYVCDTLEDTCRDINRDGDLKDTGEIKVYGQTAIPSGIYPVKLTMSPHFKMVTPRLFDIVDYADVLIHKGNFVADTKGCIIVGTRGADCLIGGTSTPAFNKMMSLLRTGDKNLFDEYEIHVIDKI